MKLAVITSGHQPYSGQLLDKSARRVGIDVIPFAIDKPWPNDYRQGKLIDALKAIRNLRDIYTHVMHVDSSDTLILAPEEEILDLWAGHCYSGVLVSAEKNCHPKPELAREYALRLRCRPPVFPWQYANSGGWIAEREVIESAIPVVSELATYCDQLCWTRGYLQRVEPAVSLDTGCTIFQTMFLQEPQEFEFHNGRLLNTVTQTKPAAIHWNGTRGAGRISMGGVWACIEIQSKPADTYVWKSPDPWSAMKLTKVNA